MNNLTDWLRGMKTVGGEKQHPLGKKAADLLESQAAEIAEMRKKESKKVNAQ